MAHVVAGGLKFLVSRPLVLPAGTLAAGCVYGFFDISKNTGRMIFGTKTATTTSYLSSAGTFCTVMYLRNLSSPHTTTIGELVKQNQFKELLKSSKSLGLYAAASLAGAGFMSGLSFAFFSEK